MASSYSTDGSKNSGSGSSNSMSNDGVDSGSGGGAGGGGGGSDGGGDLVYDPWRTAHLIEAFNIIELCVRYTERLSRDIYGAGQNVFAVTTTTSSDDVSTSSSISNNSRNSNSNNAGGSSIGSAATTATRAVSSKLPQVSLSAAAIGTGTGSSELDKLKLCKEDFEAAKISFASVRRLPCLLPPPSSPSNKQANTKVKN